MKWIVRILILLVVILGIMFLVMTCTGGSCIRRIDSMPPDVQKAAWEVATHSKIYYAEKVEKLNNGDVRLYNWYEPSGKKWLFHPGYETLPRDIYGNMQPKRR